MRAMTDRFAELITAYLRKHALDHKVFAKAVGVTPVTVSSWCRGKHTPPRMRERILGLMGVYQNNTPPPRMRASNVSKRTAPTGTRSSASRPPLKVISISFPNIPTSEAGLLAAGAPTPSSVFRQRPGFSFRPFLGPAQPAGRPSLPAGQHAIFVVHENRYPYYE